MKPLRLLCALALVVLVAPAACGQASWLWGNTPYVQLWRTNPAAVVAPGREVFVAPLGFFYRQQNFDPYSHLIRLGGGEVGARLPIANGKLGIGGVAQVQYAYETVNNNL